MSEQPSPPECQQHDESLTTIPTTLQATDAPCCAVSIIQFAGTTPPPPPNTTVASPASEHQAFSEETLEGASKDLKEYLREQVSSPVDLKELEVTDHELLELATDDDSDDDTPEPATEKQAGKRTHDAFYNPVKIRQQLKNNEWLNDEAIESLAKLLPAYNTLKVFNPGYIKFSQPTLARPPPKLTTGTVIMPLNHDNTHWTYNPLPAPDNRKDAKRLTTWFDSSAEAFSFKEVSGPQQEDGSSCGVFVLAAIDHWLQGRDLPTSFEKPSAVLLSLLDADGCSSPITPPAKRRRESLKGTFTMASTPAEMLSYLRHINATLQAQLVDQPRSTVEDATKVLQDNEEKQQGLETDLQQHQDYIQDVKAYQRAHAYWSQQVLKSPGPTYEGLDDERRRNVSDMGDAIVASVLKRLKRLSVNGEGTADLPSLEARETELQVLIEEAKKDVQQAAERLASEKMLAAIVEEAKRLVDVASI
ncbi:sentrin sumo-specific [Fusarium flagelliforme]|uniref:Sentrin sumo-specific n=1 Tax=Fusarium flagelliforme TaxID=2675880 RepID=A0A395MVQ0_9HYPO|nr:sentrin sumo-specific [Fusarium flagelliforme]